MSQTTSNLLYLVTIICFILALRFLSSPTTARRGNWIGAVGHGGRDRRHARAVTASHIGWRIIVGGAIGAAFGAVGGAPVKMTAMPQMVALFNGVGGGAAALVSLAEFHNRAPEPGQLHGDVSLAIVLSALIGSVSFAGSMVAFAKLQELIGGRPITYPGPAGRQPRVLLAAIVAGGDRDRRRRTSSSGCSSLLVARLARLRRAVRAADRRRRHAGRDLAAERVHRPRRGGDRLRARLERPDRERRARRRLRNAADDDDGAGDEPLDRERPLRCVRAGAGGRRADGGARGHGALGRRPRTSRSCSPTRSKVVVVPGLRDGGRAGPARGARARRRAREEGRRGRVRDPPGRRPHAGAHERAARRGERAVHGAEGDGRDQPASSRRPTSRS